MGIRKLKPTSPARRNMSVQTFEEVTTNRPHKSLVKGIRKRAGRNNNGHITARHRGGGHSRRYRTIDFKRNKTGIPGTVKSIEYDPNRNARIALVSYADGEYRYILAPASLSVGDKIQSGTGTEVRVGNSLPLGEMPLGTIVHNIEMRPGKGGQLVRSAGAGAQVMAKDKGYVLVKLPSGELRQVLETCQATVGSVGNAEFSNMVVGKAGRNRHLGHRPHVRGVVMNPVDHPMGGGEGRSAGGRHPCTPWGKPTKGLKTRGRKASDKFIVKRRK